MITSIPFATLMRAAAVQMLTDYAQAASIKLQVYPGRPLTIKPPTGYVERQREVITWPEGGMYRNRVIQVDIRLVWGLFDSMEAVNQRDAFVDDFVTWASDRPHAAFGSTVLEPRTIDDDPNFQPDWGPEQQRQSTYFATTLTLEGQSGGNY